MLLMLTAASDELAGGRAMSLNETWSEVRNAAMASENFETSATQSVQKPSSGKSPVSDHHHLSHALSLPLVENNIDCFGSNEETSPVKKGPWTSDEDQILSDYVIEFGEGNWNQVPKSTGLNRCGKSCRLRWTNHLRPDLKRGSFSSHEEAIIVHMHAQIGNKWARMAAQLPGRTDNEIKNFWNTRMKRRLRAGLPLHETGVELRQERRQNETIKSANFECHRRPCDSQSGSLSQYQHDCLESWLPNMVRCSGVDPKAREAEPDKTAPLSEYPPAPSHLYPTFLPTLPPEKVQEIEESMAPAYLSLRERIRDATRGTQSSQQKSGNEGSCSDVGVFCSKIQRLKRKRNEEVLKQSAESNLQPSASERPFSPIIGEGEPDFFPPLGSWKSYVSGVFQVKDACGNLVYALEDEHLSVLDKQILGSSLQTEENASDIDCTGEPLPCGDSTALRGQLGEGH